MANECTWAGRSIQLIKFIRTIRPSQTLKSLKWIYDTGMAIDGLLAKKEKVSNDTSS